MKLFGKKQKGILGIDFGAGGIKVIQLQSADGNGMLFTYGHVEFSPAETGMDYLENSKGAGELLKNICAKARTTSIRAVAALPMPAVFSAVVTIASVPRKELESAVRWEAKKLIPLPLEEVALDFKILKRENSIKKPAHSPGDASRDKKSDTPTTVLLTAAPKSIIEKYITVARVAGITLESLETEAFALIRALIGNDPTPTAIVDIGALRSNILIVDYGIPMLSRSVEVGGKKMTEAIASSTGIDLTRAEAIKRDLGATASNAGAAQAFPDVLREVLRPLLNELQYSFNVYRTRNTITRPVERIMLTGGSSGIPWLAELFEKEFNVRTFIGNPWERIKYHPDLEQSLRGFGSKFAVAIGLALRGIS